MCLPIGSMLLRSKILWMKHVVFWREPDGVIPRATGDWLTGRWDSRKVLRHCHNTWKTSTYARRCWSSRFWHSDWKSGLFPDFYRKYSKLRTFPGPGGQQLKIRTFPGNKDPWEPWTLEKNLKNYNCILQRNINAAKKNYYESKFNRYVSNIKQTWTTINELLNKCNNKKEFPSYFIINGDKIDNKEDIANNFNSFFQNIGPTLSANIPQHKNITIKTFLKEKIAFSFEFSLLEQETVFKIISKINSKHSCGYDDISTILMKNICPLILSPIPLILSPITLILNQSLSTGIFRDRLKIAKIIPLFKKEDPHKLDNYRPISLLPAFSKIFEKAVFIQLYEYFNKNNLNRISIFRNYWYHR